MFTESVNNQSAGKQTDQYSLFSSKCGFENQLFGDLQMSETKEVITHFNS
jgi:hypothetical protein